MPRVWTSLTKHKLAFCSGSSSSSRSGVRSFPLRVCPWEWSDTDKAKSEVLFDLLNPTVFGLNCQDETKAEHFELYTMFDFIHPFIEKSHDASIAFRSALTAACAHIEDSAAEVELSEVILKSVLDVLVCLRALVCLLDPVCKKETLSESMLTSVDEVEAKSSAEPESVAFHLMKRILEDGCYLGPKLSQWNGHKRDLAKYADDIVAARECLITKPTELGSKACNSRFIELAPKVTTWT